MYDLSWSEEVFDDFYRRHLLSVREVNRLYRISVDEVIKTIQIGDTRWRGYKSLVKHVEKAIKIYWKHFHSHEGVRREYYTFDKYLKKQLSRRSFPGPLDLVDTEIEQDLFS